MAIFLFSFLSPLLVIGNVSMWPDCTCERQIFLNENLAPAAAAAAAVVRSTWVDVIRLKQQVTRSSGFCCSERGETGHFYLFVLFYFIFCLFKFLHSKSWMVMNTAFFFLFFFPVGGRQFHGTTDGMSFKSSRSSLTHPSGKEHVESTCRGREQKTVCVFGWRFCL